MHLHNAYEMEGVVADIPVPGTPPAAPAPPACNVDNADPELDVLVTSTKGHVVRCEPYGLDNADVNNEELQNLLVEMFTKHDTCSSIKYASFVVAFVTMHPKQMPSLYQSAADQKCDIIGVMVRSDISATLVCRRTKVKTAFRFPTEFACCELYVPKTKYFGRARTHAISDVIHETLIAWMTAGTSCWLNFKLEAVFVWYKEDVMTQWSNMTMSKILLVIVGLRGKGYHEEET